MTTLTATAVITAVDRASAVFARVGANAHALGGRFTGAIGGLSRFGQAAAMNLGLPAAMVGGLAARSEYELDKLTRVMQAAGELTDQQRKMLTDKAFDVAAATGESVTDIVRGQRELILGGLDADTTAMTSDIIAKVARANEVAAGQVAEDAITNASALGLAMGSTEEKVRSLTKALDFMSTVPAFSPMNWQDLSTAMKYAGPVAGALKVDMADLGTALSMLAFAGFKGEEAGTALRTILTRLIAPTRKARMELRAAGIDQTQLFSIDKDKANNKDALLDSLVQDGIMTDKERARAKKALQQTSFDGANAADYTDRLNAVLGQVLGIGRGDTQDREILKAAIDNHFLRAVGDLDMEKVFSAIKDLPLKSLKEMFGLQRISQARALSKKINEIVNLPNGERISAWKKLKEEIGGAIDGASERKAAPVLTGFAATMDRVGAALNNIRHKVFESGFGADISSMFERLSGAVNSLAQTDPDRLKHIGMALTALMTAPLVGGGIAGLTALALAFTDVADLFKGSHENVLGPNGGILSKETAGPAVAAITELYNLGSETIGLFGDIATQIKGLFNLDPSTSLLAMGLKGIADSAKIIAASIREIRKFFKGEESNAADAAKSRDPTSIFGGAMTALDALTKDKPGGPGPFDWLWNSLGSDDDAAARVRARRESYFNTLNNGTSPTLPAIRDQFPAPPDRPFPTSPAAVPLPSIRAQFPDAGMNRVDVKGQADVNVKGNVTGNVTLDAKIIVEGGGRVIEQTTGGGAVSGKLDPGQSQLDLQGP